MSSVKGAFELCSSPTRLKLDKRKARAGFDFGFLMKNEVETCSRLSIIQFSARRLPQNSIKQRLDQVSR